MDIHELDPARLTQDIIGLNNLIKTNLETIDGWEFVRVPRGFKIYKGIPIPLADIRDNTHVLNTFGTKPQWLGSVETCYFYAMRDLNAANPYIPDNSNIFCYVVQQDMLLFNLLSEVNLRRIFLAPKEADHITTLSVATGYGVSMPDLKRMFPREPYMRIAPENFRDQATNRPVAYRVANNVFSGAAEHLNRVSYYNYDSKLLEIITSYCNCDGYYGYNAPSLKHKNGIFSGEMCVFFPRYTLSLDLEDQYSTVRNRHVINFILAGINFTDRIAKIGGDSTLVAPPVMQTAQTAQTAQNLPPEDRDKHALLLPLISYCWNNRGMFDVPETHTRLNHSLCN